MKRKKYIADHEATKSYLLQSVSQCHLAIGAALSNNNLTAQLSSLRQAINTLTPDKTVAGSIEHRLFNDLVSDITEFRQIAVEMNHRMEVKLYITHLPSVFDAISEHGNSTVVDMPGSDNPFGIVHQTSKRHGISLADKGSEGVIEIDFHGRAWDSNFILFDLATGASSLSHNSPLGFSMIIAPETSDDEIVCAVDTILDRYLRDYIMSLDREVQSFIVDPDSLAQHVQNSQDEDLLAPVDAKTPSPSS